MPTLLALLLLAGCAGSSDAPPATDAAGPSEPAPTEPAPAEPAPTEPAPAEPTEPAPTDDAASGPDTWTAGIVEVVRTLAPPNVVAVRTGTHAGFDRVVFEFSGPVPGWHLEYVDKPVRACGSGDPVPVSGDGWLEVRIAPASAHDDKGQPTTPAEALPNLPNVLEVERTCDFEAVTAWVVGVRSPNPYRVFELADPPRLVVDVKQ